jgi:hypothetical protein
MRDYITLTKRLAEAATPCFNEVDRAFVDGELDAGEYYFAIDDILRAAVREEFPLPANLINVVRSWLDGRGGSVPAPDKARFSRLLAQVKTEAVATPALR